ncbi:MAG: hypothetical protein HY822_15305 [Acidobacteria bacterium]|nr:hypothetical protein [Acidobacteriota bacterium]
MVVTFYNSRAEADTAAGALQARGVPAMVLEIRERRQHKSVRVFQVIVPREWADAPELGAIRTAGPVP